MKVYLPCLFLPLASALSLPGQGLILPNLNFTTLDQMFTPGNATAGATDTRLNDTISLLKCDSFRAQSVDPSSCENAWRKIPVFGEIDDDDVTFRHRHHDPPPNVVSLPLRWLSDDGKCAVDLLLNPGRTADAYDIVSGDTIVVQAERVLEECAELQQISGSIRGFSQRGQLSIVFSSYEAQLPNLLCDAVPPPGGMTPAYQQSCKTALDYIPTGTKKQTTFNVTRRNAKEVVYLLPRREPDASGPLLVYMQEPVAVTTAAWWDIWAAGIAVYTMCIERGRGGTAFNLGLSQKIVLRLGL